jgi:ABC-type spermidine/putrescine transport system permease subunit I
MECDVVILVTGANDGAMVVFIFMVGDVPMLVTGVTNGAMVVFVFVVGDVVVLLTGGAIADVPKLVNGGAMVVL